MKRQTAFSALTEIRMQGAVKAIIQVCLKPMYARLRIRRLYYRNDPKHIICSPRILSDILCHSNNTKLI